VIPILDYEIDDFSDVAGFIEGPIHVVDGDGSGETPGAQVPRLNVINVNKQAHGP